MNAWDRTEPGDDLTGRTRHRWHLEGWENNEWGMVASRERHPARSPAQAGRRRTTRPRPHHADRPRNHHLHRRGAALMREYLDDLMLWSGQAPDAADARARFTCLSAGRHANVTSLLMRDLQVDVVRDGTGDWTVSYAEPGSPERRWTGRSDTYTGAVLTMIARRCGLDGEIRGHLADDSEGE